MRRPSRRPWFTVPVVLLLAGIALAGTALWRSLNRADSVNQSVANTNQPAAGRCGDGICQDVSCTAIGCPPAETPENCPADCPRSGSPVNQNQNSNADGNDALDFSLSPQSLDDKRLCPIEEANLSPSDAVRLAQGRGLTQGEETVSLRLHHSGEPLEQCIWTVRNFDAADSGAEVVVVDATQEALELRRWEE